MSQEVIPYTEIPNFQSRAEEFFPIDWYKDMLHNHPVYFHKKTNTWNVFTYEHVKQVLSNYEFFSSEGPRTASFVGVDNKQGKTSPITNISSVDPPQHRKNRSLLAAAFTPRSLKDWEPRIQQLATELVEDIKANSTVNIVEALASPLPSLVIADLFGVPIQDRHQFKKWVDILFQPFNKERIEEIELEKKHAAKEYFEYLYPIVVQKRLDLRDDIISDLIQAEVDGEKFTDEEIIQATMLLLGAGVETTSHAIANTFYSFLYDDTSLYGELRNNVELVPNAVEEMLRYRFHISKKARTVKQDNHLLGVELKKGDVVVAWMSASNVDENMFAHPFSIDIHRSNNKKHLTFGNGPHFCLGAPLARLEMRIVLEAFLQKFSRIEPLERFELEKNLTASATGQSLTYLPIKVYS
ncbi:MULTISPECIES: cytochrome P450 [Bacillus]|uniref:cytochrome P450 n=1 Tax=Bacillus TaxID=1386 RepID=UPI00165A5207|nr:MULTISPECIES: cytochrome P450 [Bacillus subtilis group]MCY8203405.1 cytochrome P450 [Bacillus sp. N12A5]MCY8106917.1 cytochrome P450 [Bacillus mojavensis]MCY8980927.1 cytochrome P450 [Bacillus halotolerans]MEC1423307.1 cytochrome P450 [Bacillus subtilis]MEC1580082.1 cytochrome P450 [Bacillus subtilis]